MSWSRLSKRLHSYKKVFMELEFKIKRFNELSTDELYEILGLRSEVFVLEQNCVYQDIDGKDKKAIHIFGQFQGKIVAYTRIFASGDYFETASIGRVVVKEIYRHKKWGFELMKTSINAVKEIFQEDIITISAQLYLKRFYESLGFQQTSDTYLEDGIVHIQMKRIPF